MSGINCPLIVLPYIGRVLYPVSIVAVLIVL